MLNERSIFVFPDTVAKHVAYDDQVIQTFYVSHADVTELSQLLSSIIRLPGIAVQPIIQFSKTNSTITVRATGAVAQIIERIIAQNDKPRAEIVVDVEILEVDRTRAQQYGLNLSQYAIGAVLSPVVAPGGGGRRSGRPGRDADNLHRRREGRLRRTPWFRRPRSTSIPSRAV